MKSLFKRIIKLFLAIIVGLGSFGLMIMLPFEYESWGCVAALFLFSVWAVIINTYSIESISEYIWKE
jgi:hypothetical protein